MTDILSSEWERDKVREKKKAHSLASDRCGIARVWILPL
jgi:hypothetical protein